MRSICEHVDLSVGGRNAQDAISLRGIYEILLMPTACVEGNIFGVVAC